MDSLPLTETDPSLGAINSVHIGFQRFEFTETRTDDAKCPRIHSADGLHAKTPVPGMGGFGGKEYQRRIHGESIRDVPRQYTQSDCCAHTFVFGRHNKSNSESESENENENENESNNTTTDTTATTISDEQTIPTSSCPTIKWIS